MSSLSKGSEFRPFIVRTGHGPIMSRKSAHLNQLEFQCLDYDLHRALTKRFDIF